MSRFAQRFIVLFSLFWLFLNGVFAQIDPRYPPVPIGYIPDGVPALVYTSKLPNIQQLAFMQSDRNQDFDQAHELLSSGQYRVVSQSSLDNYGQTTDALWFSFILDNRLDHFTTTFLEVSDRQLERVEMQVFRLKDSGKTSRSIHLSGRSIPFSKKEIRTIKTVFPLSLEPATKALVICRIVNTGPSLVNLKLQNNSTLLADSSRSDFLFVVLGGGILMVSIFSIFVLLAMREAKYWWFLAQALCAGLAVFSANGFITLFLWRESPLLEQAASIFFLLAGTSSLIQLIRLVARGDGQPAKPVIDSIARVLVLVLLLLGILAAALPVTKLPVALFAAASLVVSVFGFRREMFKQRKDVKIMVAVVAVLVSGALVSLATSWLALSGDLLFASSSAYQIAIFLAEVGLAFLLTDWIGRLKASRDDAEERDRLKDLLMSNVSHEMRTPLNGIMGYAEELLIAQTTPPVRQAGMRIQTESKRLLRQIELMLDLARLESGRLVLHERVFGLDAFMDELKSHHLESAASKGLQLVILSHAPHDIRLVGDRSQIIRLLDQLIDNSIKFTLKGTVSVEFRLGPLTDRRVILEVSVKDTGIGIPNDKLSQIGDSFFQVDKRSTHRYGGTGLGSDLARRISAFLGGEIRVTSTLNMGSTFVLAIPVGVEPITSLVPAASLVPTATDQSPKSRPRILTVDDIETNRQVICILLRNFDLEIVCVESAELAIERLDAEIFDLITMDIYMPGMDGMEATRHIRANPKTSHIPVIGITASDSDQDISGCTESGMNAVLIKPLTRLALVRQLAEYIPMVPSPETSPSV